MRGGGFGGEVDSDGGRAAAAVLAVVQILHAATFAMQHLSAMLLLGRFVPAERAATGQALHAALG